MVWKMMLQQAVNTDYWLCKFFILQSVWPLQEIRLRFIFIIVLLLITEYTCRKYCSSLLLHGTPPFLICYLSKRGQPILKCKRNFKMKQNWQESSRIIKFQVTKNALAVQAPSSASHRKDAQWGKAKKSHTHSLLRKIPFYPIVSTCQEHSLFCYGWIGKFSTNGCKA